MILSSVFTLHGGKYYVEGFESFYENEIIPEPISLEQIRNSETISGLRIPADGEHQFRRIVGSDSGPSWAPIPVHRGQLERPMLELFHWRQTSWLPPTLREETTIDVSPEGLYASG